VHPAVADAFLAGRLDDAWASARRTETMTRSERALLRLLSSELEAVDAQAA
jgi:hypothetical protein